MIEAESQSTAHPLIYRAEEYAVPSVELWPQLDALYTSVISQNVSLALDIVEALVPEWKRAESHPR